MMKIKTSGKILSELQWLGNEIQVLLEYAKKLKAEEDYKSLTVKPNEINTIEYENQTIIDNP